MGRERKSAAGYRVLLKLLPEDFRSRWGPDMVDVFQHRLDEAGQSPVRRAWVWARGFADVVTQALVERSRSLRLASTPRGLGQDLRYGLRGLVRSPGFAVSAALTLALGIGAATATFAVLHGVLLSPLPYPESDRLVLLWPEANGNVAMVDLAREELATVEAVSGLSSWALTLNGVGEPVEIDATMASPTHFEVMGVPPVRGRGFVEGDALPGSEGVVVLSHRFWASAFGADPDVLGRVVEMSGADYDRRTIVGIMPPGYRPFHRDTDVWIPLQGDPAVSLEADQSWYVNERVARLRPGATLAEANREIRPHAEGIRARLPQIFEEQDSRVASVQLLKDYVAGDMGPVLWVTMAAVSLVLLIACGNVANLLLARGEAQARSHSVRVALGASRARVVRMLLAESALLASVGGTLGALFAWSLTGLLARLAPESFPRLDEIGVDGPVLAYGVLLSGAAVVLAGLWPALRAGRPEATGGLGGGGRGTAAAGLGRLGRGLVSLQVALALMVAVGSGLMLRSLDRLLTEEVGMDGEQVLTFKPSPPQARYGTRADFERYYDQVLERVAAVPGVTGVGAIHLLPGTGGNWSFPVFTGAPVAEGETVPSANFRAVRPGYFETLRIPLLRGRTLTRDDSGEGEPVVVVNQAFVERFWPGQDPLSQRLSIFRATGTPHRVVGVVGDVRQHRRSLAPLPEMYFAPAQAPMDQLSLWIMARFEQGPVLGHGDAVRQVVWDIDPEVPIVEMDDMEAVLRRSTLMTRFVALLLTAFGVLAVGLGAVGVFGVAAYASGRRKPEFGLRMAVGATRGSVLATALRQTLSPVGLGLLVGLASAAATSRFLSAALYEVPPTDPLTFVGVALLLAVTALLASLLPAWRASRVDPVSVLTAE